MFSLPLIINQFVRAWRRSFSIAHFTVEFRKETGYSISCEKAESYAAKIREAGKRLKYLPKSRLPNLESFPETYPLRPPPHQTMDQTSIDEMRIRYRGAVPGRREFDDPGLERLFVD